jgi:hypothetical protein
MGDSVHVKYCPKSHDPRAFREPRAWTRDESIDCYWCGKFFKDFAGLALHVQNHGVENFDEAIRYYTKQNEKEQYEMPLKPPSAQAQGANNPFITAENFNGKGKGKLVLLGGRIPSSTASFSDIFIDVKLGRESFTWGLKADSRNYAALYKRFGADEKKWKGTVDVVIAKDKYINVVGS